MPSLDPIGVCKIEDMTLSAENVPVLKNQCTKLLFLTTWRAFGTNLTCSRKFSGFRDACFEIFTKILHPVLEFF